MADNRESPGFSRGGAVNHGDDVDARQQISLDRLLKRIERIERRLELAP